MFQVVLVAHFLMPHLLFLHIFLFFFLSRKLEFTSDEASQVISPLTPVPVAWQRKSACFHSGTTGTTVAKFNPHHSEAIMRSETRITTFLTDFTIQFYYSALTEMLLPWEGKKKNLCMSSLAQTNILKEIGSKNHIDIISKIQSGAGRTRNPL